MKGMLMKELYNLKQTARIYLILTVLWMAMGMAQRDSTYLSGLIAMVMVLIPINAIAYDEASKWERYALTMPVLRRDVVAARYALMLLCGSAMTVLCCAASVIAGEPVGNAITISLGVLAVGIVLGSVLIPIMTRFGVQKGRLVLMVMALLPALLIMLFQSGDGMPEPTLAAPSFVLTLATLGIALMICLISFAITKAIYEKKEF